MKLNENALEAAKKWLHNHMKGIAQGYPVQAINMAEGVIQSYLSALPPVDQRHALISSNIGSVIGWLEAHAEEDEKKFVDHSGNDGVSRHRHYIDLLKAILSILREEL